MTEPLQALIAKWKADIASSHARDEPWTTEEATTIEQLVADLTPILTAAQAREEQLASVLDALDKFQRGSPSHQTTIENVAKVVADVLAADQAQLSAREEEIAKMDQTIIDMGDWIDLATSRKAQLEAREEEIQQLRVEAEWVRVEVGEWKLLTESAEHQVGIARAENEQLKAALLHMQWCGLCAENSWGECEEGRKAEALLAPTGGE